MLEHPPPPPARWTELIDDICAGSWVSPLNGKLRPAAPYDNIVFAESLTGREADLVAGLGFSAPFTLVSDENTHPALGQRVARALAVLGEVEEVILESPHADMPTARDLKSRIRNDRSVIAIGSGTINDLCKYITSRGSGKRRYCVFATAASMNGYTSSTASMTLDDGLKVSLPAQTAAGVFVDLEVCAAAPAYLNASGFGDSICRSTAQIDWWMSHRLLGTFYDHDAYIIEIPDEIKMFKHAAGIARGDITAIGYLFRVLTLCGLGVSFTGVSNHGSMGEHQISHYLDCFAGLRHPGSLHGQQVGVATLTMARLQRHILSSEAPPEIRPTLIDHASMVARMGHTIADQCLAEYKKKAFDDSSAEAFNRKLATLWPELRQECLDILIPAEILASALQAAGGATDATTLGFSAAFYGEAVRHAHEMRHRFSFADIACDAGLISSFAADEISRCPPRATLSEQGHDQTS